MSIPDYQTCMKPLLQAISNSKEHKFSEIVRVVADKFNLTEEEMAQKLPSGYQTVVENRIGWAKTYLKKAGLLTYPKRGYLVITEKGLAVLKENPETINVKYLERFPEFEEFRTASTSSEADASLATIGAQADAITPDELIERGYNLIKESLAAELLSKIGVNPPDFFEEVVLTLLVNMGFGEGSVTGRTGDEGIDGFINQDKLGIDVIYFQAKRFKPDNAVTASMVRDFVGSLDLKGVTKGVFITTSRFPKDTQDIISRSPKRIVLIDGAKLADLLIEYNVGVTIQKSYHIKKLDADFFPE